MSSSCHECDRSINLTAHPFTKPRSLEWRVMSVGAGTVAWTANPRGVLGCGVDFTYQGEITNLVAVGKTTVTAS